MDEHIQKFFDTFIMDDAKHLSFNSISEANDWIEEELKDEDYVDCERFAFLDSEEELVEYYNRFGCCGSYDAYITVENRPAVIGRNFGH